MSDPVVAALIGVGGAVVVAVATVITQLFVTRALIRSEREKIGLQLRGEEVARLREKRTDRIIDAVSERLAVSDPEVGPRVNYGRAVALIHRVQLLLDSRELRQAALRDALNKLGLRIRDYLEVEQRPIDDKDNETRLLLMAQGAVLERTRDTLGEVPERSAT